MFSDGYRIALDIELTYECSPDGKRWGQCGSAREYADNVGEVRALVAAYGHCMTASATRKNPRPVLTRLVVHGCVTGRLLAVLPFRWCDRLDRYEPTGGEWFILDNPRAFEAWQLDVTTTRLASIA